MKHEQMILEIKASLFDFHDLFNHESNNVRRIMEHFHQQMKSILKSNHAQIYLKQSQMERLFPKEDRGFMQSIINTNEQLYEEWEEIIHSNNEVALMTEIDLANEGVHYLYHIIMKLNSGTNFRGFYLFSYNEKPSFTKELLRELQRIIDQHFEVLSNYFHEQFIQERNRLLFQLSANLHSIHKTIDVLKRVYRSVTMLYPNFKYRFLMTHEYDDSSIPIYTIEYVENNNFLGNTAFINNEIKIDINKIKNETIVYSPLSGRQGVYGVFEITIPNQVHLNDSDYEFIKQSSKMIGRAIERTTLYQSSTQLVTDLQMINIASRDLNRNLERSEISENVKKHITTSCQAEEIGIIIFPTNDECDEKYIVTEESTVYFKSVNSKPFVRYLYKQLQERPEPILSGNFKAENIIVPFNSIMVIPMWDSEKMFGFIVIAHENSYYFSFDKYKFVQSFIQHAALAYTNSMLKERLRQTAITDYLTKLYLRNYLDKKIDEHMKSDRGGAFILLDVDDFKLVNDTHGHYVGDKVLIQIANIIKDTINDNEIAARWGGEEFAVYLPYSNEEYALEVANEIRKNVAMKTVPNVSLSIGISTWFGEQHTIEKLFIQADEALYEAKSTGKNRIVLN